MTVNLFTIVLIVARVYLVSLLRIINYQYQIVFIPHGVKQEWLCIKGYACMSTIFAQICILFHSV